MRLLLDNNLSPRLVDVLAKDGWDVVHVGCFAASDRSSRPPATTAGPSARTPLDMLATSHEPGPSVVLVQRVIGRRVEQLAGLLLANLPQVDEDLRLGSIVVIGDDSLRIRRLPIG